MSDRKKEAILITGAAGFVGRAVVKALQSAGRRLVLLDQFPAAPVAPECLPVTCDISNAEQLRGVFESQPISGIVHLAAILPTAANRDRMHATQVNVNGSLYLLALAREFGVKRLVFGSSLSIYGTCPAGEWIAESYKATPEDEYGYTKLVGERLGLQYAEFQCVEFVSLRIGRVVGPGARSTTSSWRSEIFECLRERRPVEIRIPYVGTERILLVHVDDVARSLVKLVDAPQLSHTIYNAPCESVVVADLKQCVEALNPNISVVLGDGEAVGNPRRVDWSRFQNEFGVEIAPVFEQMERAASHGG